MTEDDLFEISRDLVEVIDSKLENLPNVPSQTGLEDPYIHFLAFFIGAMVYKRLTYIPRQYKTKEQKYQYSWTKFKETKDGLQNAVASAVAGALSTYAGQDIGYYCTINPVPPVANKEPC